MLIALTVLAVSAVQAAETAFDYLQDNRSIIVRSGFDLCWHTGSWTPADAVLGCDGTLQPPITKITAPPLMVVVPPPPEPETAPAPPPRCDRHLSLAGDDAFQFNETNLRPAAQATITKELISPLANCDIERIVVKGYADRLGAASYNQQLSERRAEIVSAYLTSRGVKASFETHGMGATESITHCNDKMAHPALIACLAPDRRVSIEVFAVRRQ